MSLRVLLDTNIVSRLMRDGQGKLWHKAMAFGHQHIGVSIITACELRFGAAYRQSERLSREVDEFLNGIAVVPMEHPVDVAYADIRAHLTRSGRPIGPNDLLIAAHALALDLTVVTDNIREFSRVPNLRVENWLD